jgi:large subunit ribosomal protein L28
MSRICQITKKRPMRGFNVSHANNRTHRIQDINLNYKRFFLSELGQWVRIRVSTEGIKTLTKLGGLSPFLLKTPMDDLDPGLRQWKRALGHRLRISIR